MNSSDFDAFADVWTSAWEMYGKGVSPGSVEMAFNALIGYPLADIRRGLTRHVRNPGAGKFAPKPADVVEQLDGGVEARCHRAWALLRQGIKRVGNHASVAFDDPLIHCVVRDLGGWREVCGWQTAELPFCQQRFEKGYRAYLAREHVVHPPYLAGAVEVSNAAEGYALPAPRLVGDPDAARQVMERGERERLVHRSHQSAGQIAMRLVRDKPAPATVPHADLRSALGGE